MESQEPKFKQEIQQMMYIAGEMLDPSTVTIALIEGIIHDQVFHILTAAHEMALRRGSRYFTNNDIIFQFRHDSARISRLRNFLAWKGVRKGIKDADEKGGSASESLTMDPAIDGAMDDLTEEPLLRNDKIPSITLPWDIPSFFSAEVPNASGQDDGLDGDSNEAYLERLKLADDRTRDMTAAEYATWSEYRHASFTWRKIKKFREWAGLGVIAEHKPGDDVLDILGFLTSEMVQKLTVLALKIQKQEISQAPDTRSRDLSTDANIAEGLFAGSVAARNPIESRHVRQAFQHLQLAPKKNRAMLNGTRLPVPSEIKLDEWS